MNRRLLLLSSLFLFAFAATLPAQSSGELRFGLRADPKTFNPLLMADEPSETVSYLTHGVLLRVNRATQQLQPELAPPGRSRMADEKSRSRYGRV